LGALAQLVGVRAITASALLVPIATTVALAALSPVALGSGTPAQPKTRARPEPIVVRIDDAGFRWGDAGIGAAAGFGIALVLAGSLALTGRRDRGRDRSAPDREAQLREPLATRERTSIDGRD